MNYMTYVYVTVKIIFLNTNRSPEIYFQDVTAPRLETVKHISLDKPRNVVFTLLVLFRYAGSLVVFASNRAKRCVKTLSSFLAK